MGTIRGAIYDLLNDSEADVYPMVAPQELTDPYAVYSIRTAPIRSQEGIEVTDVELTLDIFANVYSDCVALAATMFAGIENASGTYDTTETLMVANWETEDGQYIEDLNKYMITQTYQLRFT